MQSRKKEISFAREYCLLIMGFLFSLIMDKKSQSKPCRLISVLQLLQKRMVLNFLCVFACLFIF